MWDLYVEYQRRLAEYGIDDFNDVLIMARDELSKRPLEPGYEAVFVDEVQDLTLVGLQLLHVLSGDGPDALFIIGDGQ